MGAGVHQAIAGDVATFGDGIVVEIMRAGDLDRARAEILVGVFVGDDRDQAAMLFWSDRDFAELADDGCVTFVRRVHRNRAIAQHGFRAGGGDRDIVAHLAQSNVAVLVSFDIFIAFAPRERVFEMPHMAGGFDIFDLEIRDRGFEMRIPVDQAFSAINQTLVIHVDKDLDHGVVEILLGRFGITGRAAHGERLARPVAGCAQALELADDIAARFRFLVPDEADEFLAAHIGAAAIGFGQFAFDHHLGGDARMVGAGLPERVMAAHPVPADQDILQRVVEGMAHMQRAGDIGRRDHDGEGFVAGGVGPGLERLGLFPGGVNAGFGLGGVEGFFHRHRSGFQIWRLGHASTQGAREGKGVKWRGRSWWPGGSGFPSG